MMSVHAAVSAVIANDSMSGLLRACTAFTGDVDTVATIALAAASCCEEITADLPEHLVTHLETGTYGLNFLRALDNRLTKAY